jgi:FkbM family methyltransferase
MIKTFVKKFLTENNQCRIRRCLYQTGCYPNIKSTYLNTNFTKHIHKEDIKIIFELGSRDLLDALCLSRFYNAKVFAFECNPDSILLCRRNAPISSNVSLLEKAVWDKNEKIKFYPVVESYEISNPNLKHKNIGASSCFRQCDDYHEKLVQSEIKVEAVRLDDFCKENRITSIDLICMDLQGASLHALRGLGDLLKGVSYIITELEDQPIYIGQDCYKEVFAYLKDFCFEQTSSSRPKSITGEPDPWADYLFINRLGKRFL